MRAGEFEQVSCNLCGAEETTIVYRSVPDRRHGIPGDFALVKCARCGLVRTDPQPTPDSIGWLYPASYSSFSETAAPRGAMARLARALIRLPHRARYGDAELPASPKPGLSRALDVGCGTGALLEHLSGTGWEVWGIEPNAGAAATARARLRVPDDRIAEVAVEAAELPPAHFDLVTMSHVLEHLREPVAVLRRAAQWLRPGGVLRLWLPNVESFESRLFRTYWFGLDVPRHLYHFVPATIQLALERAGLSVVDLRPQLQATSLAGSVGLRLNRRPASRARYYAALPLASLAAVGGDVAVMDVVAEKQTR